LLFLKLLETQICKYKESNKKFLDCENIKNFNDLNDLFFEVLGIETGKREQRFKDKYPQVPYLNSALFEASETEEKNIQIRALRDNEILPYYPGTCLSIDKHNKTELTALQYLLKFLDSYNFSSTANEDTADNDKIINASILGRIFEKINGYKDGAVFTPSFITMYMCRETLQRAVIDKFNEKYGWKCADLTALYNNLDYSRREEYNETINSLTVCDPAVGSGHFLVSALNEIIRIKSELGLLYHKGRKIKCSIDIQNDELVVSRGDEMFRYDYKDPDSQEIQECLFNEKKTIIENCLFGVDINPNSVNICRLRLWIELLKNTYYKPETGYKELETLPNIDINIKCGNSLISAIKIELGKGAEYKDKSIKSHIKAYKDYVRQYKETKDNGKKAELNNYISNIKKSLTPVFQPRIEYTEEDKKFNEEHEKNNIYKNSLEWMIEFPEILDDKGVFRGFDVVIGNPPYGVSIKGNEREEINKTLGHCPDYEIYYYFIELAQKLLKENKSLSYIIPNTWLFNVNAAKYRIALNSKWKLDKITDCTKFKIFDGVSVYNSIIFFKKGKSNALSYLPTNGINDFESL
ncbi:MAG: Eco57I restriction-modification methylase domain-containing protein, partial [Elusimicrobiales bacterium]|nr:Eco57I restriction-modification methylase domain-containing protein [Elusimicrobiales bacterium]